MKILLLGSGGREHAFAWKLVKSPLCSGLFIAPGNAGTAACGKNILLDINDFKSVGEFCLSEKIEMVLVGPEEPLVKGIYDHFKTTDALRDIMVIGPSAHSAKLEGSKAFAKDFMKRHNIPTARYREFSANNFDQGIEYIRQHPLPIVLKADGLAAGKGVLICQNHVEAMSEFDLMIHEAKFGDAGRKVVVEEFLDGIELSVFALTDGENYVMLPEAKDYKRVGLGDSGLNTGGMGAVSPVPFAGGEFMKKVIDRIVEPTIRGIRSEKFEYKGFVFFGIINVAGDPFVIEYNCRMGDPETEAVLPRLKNDLVELLIATSRGRLDEINIEQDPRASASIVAVSGGYPGHFEKGLPVDFGYLENSQAMNSLSDEKCFVFHAGTKEAGGEVETNGGRVMVVTSLADSIKEAVDASRALLSQIHYDGMYFRRDIGHEFY